jgi:hypothetical protein
MPHCFSDDGATSRALSILSRAMLDAQIARRRAALAVLEAEMTAACELADLGARLRASASVDHADWDRATRHRSSVTATVESEPRRGSAFCPRPLNSLLLGLTPLRRREWPNLSE